MYYTGTKADFQAKRANFGANWDLDSTLGTSVGGTINAYNIKKVQCADGLVQLRP